MRDVPLGPVWAQLLWYLLPTKSPEHRPSIVEVQAPLHGALALKEAVGEQLTSWVWGCRSISGMLGKPLTKKKKKKKAATGHAALVQLEASICFTATLLPNHPPGQVLLRVPGRVLNLSGGSKAKVPPNFHCPSSASAARHSGRSPWRLGAWADSGPGQPSRHLYQLGQRNRGQGLRTCFAVHRPTCYLKDAT